MPAGPAMQPFAVPSGENYFHTGAFFITLFGRSRIRCVTFPDSIIPITETPLAELEHA